MFEMTERQLSCARQSGMYYDGDLHLPVGSAVRISSVYGELVVCRVAEEDEPYSCGFECCGVAQYAYVAVPAEDFPA